MMNKLSGLVTKMASNIRIIIRGAVTNQLSHHLRSLRDRHTDLMTHRAAYRTQIAASAAAVVALAELPSTWATLVLALVAIYVATFTPNRHGWYPSALPESDDLEDGLW